MEDDTGPKAPVTRLRRRLSVEQTEESKSPATNTPTLRRGRRAAKPDLELIEENATVKTPLEAPAKKAITKDLTEISEEKPVTPSRRSARIRSNTSIISETPSVVDSPRAKRAARRISQVGSDTETSVTPVRLTRRTRKDSISSIDKVDNQSAVKPDLAPEPITEETETAIRKSITSSSNILTEANSNRKSPRLLKKDRNSIEHKNVEEIKNDSENSNISDDLKSVLNKTKAEESSLEINTQENSPTKGKNVSACAVVLEILDCEPQKQWNRLNKSTSALDKGSSKSKRSRTKSLTTVSMLSANDNPFYSDNETAKKRAKPVLQIKSGDVAGSGDNVTNTNGEINKSIIKDNKSEVKHNETIREKDQHPFNDKDLNSNNKTNAGSIDRNYIFDEESKELRTTPDCEISCEKLKITNIGDQCVPEVSPIIQSSKNNQESFNESKSMKRVSVQNILPINESYDEPMDVDETIPKALLLQMNAEENTSLSNTSKTSCEKSKRKSSISKNIDNSGNQSKSTLILSHFKDESIETSKSPKHICQENKLLSQSSALNITQENIPNKKNISSCYSTSTPLQQKHYEVITKNNLSAKSKESPLSLAKSNSTHLQSDSEDSEVTGLKSKHVKKNSGLTSSESEEDDQERNSLLDGEAEDAGEDYQSGDSQDEEEKEYIANNEIIESGETLSTEDELSNDSDYENDSFVVSSCDEDDELLEGTEDDLSMSDNELKMTPKSKKKYNERKLKEQKRASKEMFESRHKLNTSKNSSVSETEKKKKKERKLSSSSESDYDIKKSKMSICKQRLDSSQDESIISDTDKKTKAKRSKTPTQSISKNSLNSENANKSFERDVSMTCSNSENVNNQTNTNGSLIQVVKNEDPIESGRSNDDSSMSSDNEKIVQDYESILQDLNKTNKKKTELKNLSLNQQTKSKKKEKNPIVDELNLTQVKSKKRYSKSKESSTTIEKSVASKLAEVEDDSTTSESDYLKLMFSEESNNCEDVTNNAKSADNDDVGFIALKKTAGKTNIHNDIDKNFSSLKQATDTILNESKKYMLHLDAESSEDNRSPEDADVKFFIDTEGRYKKKTSINNKSLNRSKTIDPEITGDKSDSDAPLEVSYKKEVNELKLLDEEEIQENTAASEVSVDISIKKTPQSGKKKKKQSFSEEAEVEIDYKEISVHKSGAQTPVSGKKKKQVLDTQAEPEISVSVSPANKSTVTTPESAKKKKQKPQSNDEASEELLSIDLDKSGRKTPQSGKKKRKQSIQHTSENAATNDNSDFDENKEMNRSKVQDEKDIQENTEINLSMNKSIAKTPESGKKKKKRQSSVEPDPEIKLNEQLFNKSVVQTPASGKKKNKKQLLEEEEETAINKYVSPIGKSAVKTPQSEKKKKHKIQLNDRTIEELYLIDSDVHKSSGKTPQSDKKKQKASAGYLNEEATNAGLSVIISAEMLESGKKKRKSLGEEENTENSTRDISKDNSVTKTLHSVKKRKEKFSNKLASEELNEGDNEPALKTKKNKKKSQNQKQENIESNSELVVTLDKAERIGKDKDSNGETNVKNVAALDQGKTKKRKRKLSAEKSEEKKGSTVAKDYNELKTNKKKKQKLSDSPLENNSQATIDSSKKNKNKKRKEREDEDIELTKTDSLFKKIKVSRLPSNVLEKLDENPRIEVAAPAAKTKVVSTTGFHVQEIRRRKNKPSMYLEESIYLHEEEKLSKKRNSKKDIPTVLPFVPTASTSNAGYTTNFKVNVIKSDTVFTAQSTETGNFKKDYLYNKTIKRIGTQEMYKKGRNIKLSKF